MCRLVKVYFPRPWIQLSRRKRRRQQSCDFLLLWQNENDFSFYKERSPFPFRPMAIQNIMAEAHCRNRLLTSWRPGSRRAGGWARDKLYPPTRPYLLIFHPAMACINEVSVFMIQSPSKNTTSWITSLQTMSILSGKIHSDPTWLSSWY